MAIRVIWDNSEQTILRYIFDPHWEWEDFAVAREEGYGLIDRVTHPIGVILDTPSDMWVPTKVLLRGRSAMQNTHVNTVILVFIVPNPAARLVYDTLIKIAVKKEGCQICIADSLDEARRLVVEHLAERTATSQS